MRAGVAKTPLSRAQRGWLGVIDRQEQHGESGNDCDGDLSIRTGNYAATHHSLIRRGLVTAEYDHFRGSDDDPWEYHLTDAGRAELKGGSDGE